ncbi:hypothetical protein Pr1d_33700 [Bythopirellula goksoeyrii]|uniref:Uncharacterized protein n=1 Tax=Bythopirellula goksoeyrii TaxID=1400387 RepID=A0A5B9QPK5_9BACT|nr:hypothetical protein Pr1d_33700 [Bythopirellula goksoeyrii]
MLIDVPYQVGVPSLVDLAPETVYRHFLCRIIDFLVFWCILGKELGRVLLARRFSRALGLCGRSVLFRKAPPFILSLKYWAGCPHFKLLSKVLNSLPHFLRSTKNANFGCLHSKSNVGRIPLGAFILEG